MTLPDCEILRIARIVTDESSRRFHRHSAADRDEIRSDALLGIAKALRDHDHSQVPVAAYAFLRARGEVMDGIRRRSPLSRTDLANGLTVATIPAQRRPTISLQQVAERCDLHTLAADPASERPYRQVEDEMCPSELLDVLKPRERAVVIAYFWKGQLMWEIAEDLGVTESRVSQIIAESLKALRHEAAA